MFGCFFFHSIFALIVTVGFFLIGTRGSRLQILTPLVHHGFGLVEFCDVLLDACWRLELSARI